MTARQQGERSSSVQFSRSVVSDFLWPHEPQHTRPPCSTPTPRAYPNPCPLSWWCHPTISSSVVPFSHLQSFQAPRSFQMSQFFASGGPSIGVSASTSVLPMDIQDWFSLGWTCWISLHHHLYATIIFQVRYWEYCKPGRHDPCLQNNLTAWIEEEKRKKKNQTSEKWSSLSFRYKLRSEELQNFF